MFYGSGASDASHGTPQSIYFAGVADGEVVCAGHAT